MAWTWEELAGRALARQFSASAGDVASLVARTGPLQTQTARSTHLGIAARRSGTTREEIAAAFTSSALVRGSTVRGTVHTATPEQFALLQHPTSLGQRSTWRRVLGVDDATVEALWAAVEQHTGTAWRSVDELAEHQTGWLRARGLDDAADRLAGAQGRYLLFGHGGLVRRPVNGAWEGQGRPEYRSARALTGLAPGRSMAEVVRLHLRSHGPASRHDLAWWSGVGLRVVDAALAEVGLDPVPGPDGRDYVDLPDSPGPVALPGVRLLPEFDALLCAYEPSARARFVTPEHHRALWHSANGQVLSPLLVDGRITGFWRAMGSARRRPLEVHWFAGTRRPRTGELEGPVQDLSTALGIRVTEVTVSRA
ncbi:MAG: DNA glycosylase AlkZ-like family protein [Nocardioides sp.]|uniref:DNA glycosylase AlkZ-like family protein n=1 Tax=Nocardioides sp. TaxID=35761 RepID=UPI003F04ECB0